MAGALGIAVGAVFAGPQEKRSSAAKDSEEASYQKCWRLFSGGASEPEPPPGLRAPPTSERHQRALRQYRVALQAWEKQESERRADLERRLTLFLARFPTSARVGDARYLRGAIRYQSGRFELARPDLAFFLRQAPPGPARKAAQQALAESCRALGDFRGALAVLGPTPNALEEAGRVVEAIAAARMAGDEKKATEWSWIGRRYEGSLTKWPAGARVVLVKSGQNIPNGVLAELSTRFSKEKIGIAVAKSPETAIYLLDGNRLIHAVNPRLDTLIHRIRALLVTSRGKK